MNRPEEPSTRDAQPGVCERLRRLASESDEGCVIEVAPFLPLVERRHVRDWYWDEIEDCEEGIFFSEEIFRENKPLVRHDALPMKHVFKHLAAEHKRHQQRKL